MEQVKQVRVVLKNNRSDLVFGPYYTHVGMAYMAEESAKLDVVKSTECAGMTLLREEL